MSWVRSTQARVGAGLLVVGVVLAVIGVFVTISDDDSSASRATSNDATPEVTTARASTPVTTPRPTATTTAARATPTTVAPETPQAFFALLTQAFASGDVNTLHARLHPLVLARYGTDQCRSYLASLSVPRFSAQVLSVGSPEPWDWTLDGRTDRLPSAIPVRVRITDDGTTFRENETHLVMADNRARWFTDCGTPL